MKTATCFLAAATLVALVSVTVEAGGPSVKATAKPSRVSTPQHMSYQGETIPLLGANNSIPLVPPEVGRVAGPQQAHRSPIQRTSASFPSHVAHDARLHPSAAVDTVSYSGCTGCSGSACGGGCEDTYLDWDTCCGDPDCVSCDTFFHIGAGIELTFLKPHYEQPNSAFGREFSNDVTFRTFTDTEFDSDTDVAPRVWLSVTGGEQLGMRVEFWQYDHDAPRLSGRPPANGFGSIFSPTIGTRRLVSNTPDSVLTASSALDAWLIDVAATQKVFFGCWGLETLGGIRYARIEQAYNGTLIDDDIIADDFVERLRFYHKLQGVGPTFGVHFRRSFGGNFSLFGKARGSLLFGDGKSNLLNVEDPDLANDFTFTDNTSRDDVFSISELQVGIGWSPGCVGRFVPSAQIAYEGQLWGNVGSPSDVRGDLGFHGFNIGLGCDW